MARIFEAIAKIAKAEGLDNGYRVINNCGEDGGQTVFYMCEMAADDDFAIYSVEFNYPAANAKTCDPIVGDFMKNFTYDR